MQVGDLVKVSVPTNQLREEDNWSDSVSNGSVGIVTDAFYGDVDSDGKKIIIYTVLLFPERDPFGSVTNKSEKFYVSNEYEYDVIAYLMMPPVDLSEFTMTLGGNFLL